MTSNQTAPCEAVAALKKIASCEMRSEGDVVDIARKALEALSSPCDRGGGEAFNEYFGLEQDTAFKVASDLHAAYEALIYGLPKYLEAVNLTDEENMIREAWITLDKTAHRLACLARPTLPEGWVAVPREPTDAMTAAANALWGDGTGVNYTQLDPDDFYRAMLSALPLPFGGGGFSPSDQRDGGDD